MSTKASVEMYLCAFHLGRWEVDESVEDAYHRALNITAAQFRRMQRDDYATLQEKHADAIHRMYEAAGVNPKTATEAEKTSLRLRLMDEARKGGMRFPASSMPCLRNVGPGSELRPRPFGGNSGPVEPGPREACWQPHAWMQRRPHRRVPGPRLDQPSSARRPASVIRMRATWIFR